MYLYVIYEYYILDVLHLKYSHKNRSCFLKIEIIHSYQFISFKEVWAAHGWRHSNTTTESALAGIKPNTKTFLVAQE